MHAFQSLWILLATMLFAVMAVFVKVAAEHFGVLELVFYRSAISGVILLAIAKVWKKTLRTGNFRTHFWRGITGFLSLTLFFFRSATSKFVNGNGAVTNIAVIFGFAHGVFFA